MNKILVKLDDKPDDPASYMIEHEDHDEIIDENHRDVLEWTTMTEFNPVAYARAHGYEFFADDAAGTQFAHAHDELTAMGYEEYEIFEVATRS